MVYLRGGRRIGAGKIATLGTRSRPVKPVLGIGFTPAGDATSRAAIKRTKCDTAWTEPCRGANHYRADASPRSSRCSRPAPPPSSQLWYRTLDPQIRMLQSSQPSIDHAGMARGGGTNVATRDEREIERLKRKAEKLAARGPMQVGGRAIEARPPARAAVEARRPARAGVEGLRRRARDWRTSSRGTVPCSSSTPTGSSARK